MDLGVDGADGAIGWKGIRVGLPLGGSLHFVGLVGGSTTPLGLLGEQPRPPEGAERHAHAALPALGWRKVRPGWKNASSHLPQACSSKLSHFHRRYLHRKPTLSKRVACVSFLFLSPNLAAYYIFLLEASHLCTVNVPAAGCYAGKT